MFDNTIALVNSDKDASCTAMPSRKDWYSNPRRAKLTKAHRHMLSLVAVALRQNATAVHRIV